LNPASIERWWPLRWIAASSLTMKISYEISDFHVVRGFGPLLSGLKFDYELSCGLWSAVRSVIAPADTRRLILARRSFIAPMFTSGMMIAASVRRSGQMAPKG
jgi:hypothetical protein